MSYDEINISLSSNRSSTLELGGKEAATWKFADCLQLPFLLEDGERLSIRENSLEDSLNITSVDEISFGKENDDAQTIYLKKKENYSQKFSNSSKGVLTPITIKSNINLQNIPEAEAEETPVRNNQIPSYLRNTISFSQHSGNTSGSQSYKKNKRSLMLTDQENNPNPGINRNSLGTSARRLFTSEATGNSFSTISNSYTPNSTSKGLMQKEIISKVDSNLREKTYHQQIIKKNKQGGNIQSSQQQTNTANSTLNISENDMTVSTVLNNCSYSSAKINNQLSEGSYCLEDFHKVLSAPDQNVKLKLHYYEYLLEETQVQHQKFITGIANIIDKESASEKERDGSNNKFLDLIEQQRTKTQQFQEEIATLKHKSAELSQLVIMYREQIVRMNCESQETLHLIKGMQDELSTIILMFQFGDHFTLHSNELFEGESISFFITRQLEMLRASALEFLEKRNECQNQHCKQIIIKDKLAAILESIQAQQENNKILSHLEYSNVGEISVLEELDQIVDRLSQEVQLMQDQKLLKEKETDDIFKQKERLIVQLKILEENSEEEKINFDKTIEKLKRQMHKLKQSSLQLESELFNLKIDKKKTAYNQLAAKLECQFSTCKLDQCSPSIISPSQRVYQTNSLQQSQEIYKTNNCTAPHHKRSNTDKKGVSFSSETKDNYDNLSQRKVVNQEELCRIALLQERRCLKLDQELKGHHQIQSQYKQTIFDFFKLLDCLESCIYVNSEGDLITDSSLAESMLSPQLKSWTDTFLKNYHILFQQFIKRQIESKANLSEKQNLKLKHLIYSCKYDEYFTLLFSFFDINYSDTISSSSISQ